MGEASATDLRACVVDLAHVRRLGIEADGLVELNFLKKFRVTLDFEDRVLTFELSAGEGRMVCTGKPPSSLVRANR